MPDVVVAVDIGGTKTAAALLDDRSLVLASVSAATPGAAGPAAIVATATDLVLRLLTAHPGHRAVGLGVAAAGVVDTRTGSIISSTDTLAGWSGTPLAERMREALGRHLPSDAPVMVQNDVDAHAVGEYRFGSAAGARSALVVAVGTGIGAGIILDGRPVTGAHNTGGEIAHVPVPGADHLRCPCGRNGHLEAIGSGVGLHRHFLALGGSADVADARGVVNCSRFGDALAERALADSASAVGRAVAGAVALLDPECVVFTGGVTDIGDAWWQPMRIAYRAEAIDVLADVPLRPGLLGADAPLRGAAAHTWARIDPSNGAPT